MKSLFAGVWCVKIGVVYRFLGSPWVLITCNIFLSLFLFLFFKSHFYFPASGQAVVSGVVPSPPRFMSPLKCSFCCRRRYMKLTQRSVKPRSCIRLEPARRGTVCKKESRWKKTTKYNHSVVIIHARTWLRRASLSLSARPGWASFHLPAYLAQNKRSSR